MIKHILFSTDLGAFTPFALSHVESLVEQYECHVSIVHAVPAIEGLTKSVINSYCCLLYTSPSPRDKRQSRMPSSA